MGGPAPSGVSQVDPPPLVGPLEVSSDTFGPGKGGDTASNHTAATRRSPRLETPPSFLPRPSSPPPQPDDVDFGAAGGGDTGGADSGGAGPGVADSRCAESGDAGSGGADFGGAASPSGGGVVGAPAGGAGAAGAGGAGGTGATSAGRAGAGGSGGAGAAGTEGIGATSVGRAGAGGAGGARGAGPGGAGAGGTRGTGAAGAGGAGAGGARATGGTGTALRRPFFYPQPQPSLQLPNSALRQSIVSLSLVLPPLFALSSSSSTCPRHAHFSASSSVPQRVAMSSPPASSLPDVTDPESDLARAASPTFTCLLATFVNDPSFKSTASSALVAELVDFSATCRLDYVASLVTESGSDWHPHKLALEKQDALLAAASKQPRIDEHRAAVDVEKIRVTSLLDALLFVSDCDAPMGTWVKLVQYLARKGVQWFPKKGYGTYYTTYGYDELTQSLATWLQTTQLEHILRSPFISIDIDESMDRVRGKHLILYATFVRESVVVTEFMQLITVEKADASTLLSLLLSHLQAVGVDLQRISGISTDGASVMMGSQAGLVVRLREKVPHLVSCHCIAHR
ncbi:unnamed protein product [Closterium sp. NIES-53]